MQEAPDLRHALACIPAVFLVLSAPYVQSLSGLPASASQTITTNAGKGAISGVVKDAASGRPIAGVVVALRFPAVVPQPLARIQRQATDERGRFVFRDLPIAAGFTISAASSGHADGAYGQNAMLGPSGRISLAEGEWFATADILMWKPGAISGRVVDEFNEPLVGVYVRALARQMIAGRPQLLAGPVALTDDRGEFRIAGVLPGTYIVQVPSVQTTVPTDAPATILEFNTADPTMTRPDFPLARAPSRTDAALDPIGSSRLLVGNYATPPPTSSGRAQAYPMTFYPTGQTYNTAQPIEIGLGAERQGLDLVLRPVATTRIFGTAQGPPDALAGLVLRLMPAGLEDLGAGGEAATTLVAADGSFAFLNVPPGEYVIDAPRTSVEVTYQSGSGGITLPQTPGPRFRGGSSSDITGAPPGTGYIRQSGRGEDTYWARTSVTVAEADIVNLAVTLNRSQTLTGRFVYEGTTRTTIVETPVFGAGGRSSTAVAVTETTPRPVRMPTISAEPAHGSPSLGLPRSLSMADSGPDDPFTIDGLKGGEYVLRVQSAGSRFWVKSITIDGEDYTHKSLDASRPGRPREVLVTLTDKATTLGGSVRDGQGAPTPAAVIVFPVEREQWIGYGFTPVRIKATPVASVAGYEFEGLPPGDYHVIAVDPSFVTAWQDPAFLAKAVSLATRVTLSLGDAKTANLIKVQIR
jgi:hypothetical protein